MSAHECYVEMIVKACRTNIIAARRIAARHRKEMTPTYVSFVTHNAACHGATLDNEFSLRIGR